MKKLFSLFVLFLFVFSVLSISVSAESGSGSDGSNDSDADVEDDNGSGVEDTDDDLNETDDDLDDDLEDENELEDEAELEDEEELEDEDGLVAGAVVECRVDTSLIKKSNEIMLDIREAEKEGNLRDVVKLKEDLQKVNQELRTKGQECKMSNSGRGSATAASGQGLAVAVGLNCRITDENRVALDAAWESYRAAIDAGDEAAAEAAKADIKAAEVKLKEERQTCMTSIVPGQSGATSGQVARAECAVPQELFEELERLTKEARALKSAGTELTDEQKTKISEVEDKISGYKARCRALPVDRNVEAGKVAEYFKGKISEVLSDNEDPEAQVKALKELRKEIDETIQNLIREKKKLRFSEIEDVTEEVTINSDGIAIGDTETEADSEVEIETEVEGSSVTVSTDGETVVLNEDGLEVSTESVTIDSEGLKVDGTAVNLPPAAVLNKNKYLERNRDRVTEMKLEKDGEKAVYKTKYAVKKKFLGFIPATANQELQVDATSGDVISDKKPWWSGLSTEVEAEAEVETETAGTENTEATQ